MTVEIGALRALLSLDAAQFEVAQRRVRQDLGAMRRDFDRTAQRTSRLSGALSGPGFRNATLQLSQVAQQASATGQPLRALAIQLPDITAFMGPLGIALGAVAGGLLTLGVSALSSSDDIEDAEEALDAFNSSLDRIKGSFETVATPLAELREEFGRFAESVREDALFFANLELDALGGVVEQAVDSIRGPVEEFEQLRRDLFDTGQQLEALQGDLASGTILSDSVSEANVAALQERIAFLSDDIDGLTESFGVNQGELLQLIGDLDRLAEAEGPEQIAEAASRVLDNFTILRTINGELDPQFAEIAERVGEMRDSAARVVAIMDQVEVSTDGVSTSLGEAVSAGTALATLDFGNIANAASAAAQLAQELSTSVATASQLLTIQQTNRQRGRGADGEVIFDPRDPRFDSLVADQARAAEVRVSPGVNPFAPSSASSGRSGGGGGGAREVSAAAREADAAIRRAREAAVSFADVQQILNERLAQGAIDQRTYNLALEEAEEGLLDVGDAAEFWNQQQSELVDGILDAIVSGESLAETFQNIARSIAKAALEAALFGSGPFSGPNSGNGLLGGLISFNGGGFTGLGPRSGGVDGRGGFPAILHPNETVIDHNQISRARSAGGMGGTTVNVINNSGQQVQTRQGTGPDGRELVEIVVGDGIAGGRFDGALGTRFGSQPKQLVRG